MKQNWWIHGLVAAAMIGCGPSGGGGNITITDSGADAGDTATTDVATDQSVGTDSATDSAPTDSGADVATTDGGTDGGGTDGATDGGGTDGGTDGGGTDGATDGATDGSTDARTDAATDVPPAPDMCGMAVATVTVPGMAYMRDGTTMGMSAISGTTCRTTGGGPEEIYALNVTSRSVVNIDTEGMRTTYDTLLSVRRTCNDRMTEVACDDDGGRGTTSRIRTVLDPGMYSIIVDGYGTGTGSMGPYALAVRSAAPAANGACAMATTLAPGASLMGQNTTGAYTVSTDCGGADGAQLFYSITVPAMSAVTVRATPTGTPAWAPAIRVKNICTDTACVIRSTGEMSGMPSSTTLTNGSAMARTYVFSVASNSTTDGTFDLSASMPTTVVRGGTCDAPIALDPMTPAMAVDGTRGTVSGAARCVSGVTGVQTYFSIRVPGGNRATLVATPTGAWAPTLRVLEACTGTGCFDSRTGMASMPTTLAVDNASLLPKDFIVTVAGASPTAGGTFNLTVAYAALPAPTMPAPYTFSTITPACDDVSTGTAVAPMAGWSDDSASAVAALPFTARFFGADATHYSVSSNGFMQLWPSMTATTSSAASNSAFPDTGNPRGAVAPFWDDLFPIDAMTSTVRVATLGTMPTRRFVAQWRDWAHYNDRAVRVTFQAKVFEGTGVIEFHYCAGAPMGNVLASGSSATIGIQNGAGTSGLSIADGIAGSTATTAAYRLTPR